ncbi:UNVERIFIED_CONTAM: hypothetical protein HDU68_008150 [Siphonaria sp. JEL0065]|nr:hypothetical protein HDU68_008150 [Siphonaria sp. JEL0065]
MIERQPTLAWVHSQSPPKASMPLNIALADSAVAQGKMNQADATSFDKLEAPQIFEQPINHQPISPVSQAHPPPLLANQHDGGAAVLQGFQSALSQPITIPLQPALDTARRRGHHRRSNSMSNYVQTDKDGTRSIGGVELPRTGPYVVPKSERLRHFGQLRD